MAKRRVNKSQKIRETLESLGHETAPKAVVAALAAQRIRVTAQQVSQVKLKRTVPSTNGSADIDLEQLLAAKKFVSQFESVGAARRALAGLAKLVE